MKLKNILFLFIVLMLFSCSEKVTQPQTYVSKGTIIRKEIQDYATVSNLRNATTAPTKNDKVFVRENESVYYYDASDNESLDDSINIIRQGSYRWKRIFNNFNLLTKDGLTIGATNEAQTFENGIKLNNLLTLRKSLSTTPFISLFDNYDTEIIRLNADHNTNLFIGSLAGLNNTPLSSTQGQENMFIGSQSGYNNTTGYANTFLGYQSGFNNTTGVTNINIGYSSGYNNQTGNYNTCIGVDAGAANTGSNNMFIGFHTGGSFTPQLTGGYNTFIGNEIGYYGTSLYQNTVIGNRAGYNLTTAYNNILNGYLSGFSLTTGYNNILSGVEAGTNIQTSYNNVYLGFRSGFYANNSSYHNIGIGTYSLFSLTSGNQNTAIGTNAGFSITTGTQNTFIGSGAGNTSQLANASNSIAIGYNTYTTASNQVVLGNSSITQTILRGTVAIGTTNISSCAALDITSTSKGFLPPRMTSSQRDNISSPEEGLIIYNTDTHRHQGYNGTIWNDLY